MPVQAYWSKISESLCLRIVRFLLRSMVMAHLTATCISDSELASVRLVQCTAL